MVERRAVEPAAPVATSVASVSPARRRSLLSPAGALHLDSAERHGATAAAGISADVAGGAAPARGRPALVGGAHQATRLAVVRYHLSRPQYVLRARFPVLPLRRRRRARAAHPLSRRAAPRERRSPARTRLGERRRRVLR